MEAADLECDTIARRSRDPGRTISRPNRQPARHIGAAPIVVLIHRFAPVRKLILHQQHAARVIVEAVRDCFSRGIIHPTR